MKLKTFICTGVGAVIAGAGITAAVCFAGLEKQNTPYLRVVTKETYQQLKKQQGVTDANVSTTPVAIDYGSLPTSGVNFMDLLTNKISGNSYIITVGSEAYAQTRKLLYNADSNNNSFSNEVDSSALMLKLYDLFYNENSDRHNLVADYADSMKFYSFIDIVFSKEVNDAANLLHERRTQMGDELPETNGQNITGQTLVSNGHSKLWKVFDEKENKSQMLPVVKNSSGSDIVEYNYEPTDAYYEFRKDNKFDTEYEKVFFRNQNAVTQYNDTITWASSFASSFLQGASFSKEGGIVCAKQEEGKWYYSAYTDASDQSLEAIIEFYTKKEEKPADGQNADGSSQNGSGAEQDAVPPSDGGPAPASLAAVKQSFERISGVKPVPATPIFNEKKY